MAHKPFKEVTGVVWKVGKHIDHLIGETVLGVHENDVNKPALFSIGILVKRKNNSNEDIYVIQNRNPKGEIDREAWVHYVFPVTNVAISAFDLEKYGK